MGIHRRFEVTPPGAGQEPIPFPPKVGKVTESCEEVSTCDLIVNVSAGEEWKGADGFDLSSLEIINLFRTGAIITLRTHESWYGVPYPPDVDGDEEAKVESGEDSPGTLIDDEPNKLRRMGTSDQEEYYGEKDDEFIFKGTGVELPKKLVKREEYEIKKKVEKVNAKGEINVDVEIHAENKKENLLEKKVNKKEGVSPIENLVQGIIDKVNEGVDIEDQILTQIDKTDVVTDGVEWNEMYAHECLDICAKLAGANWTITDGTLHFFKPDSRPHPVLCTTAPYGLTPERAGQYDRDNFQYTGTYLEDGALPGEGEIEQNSIRKSSIEITEDASNLTNKFQIANSGEPTPPTCPREEVFVGNGKTDEFHLSYEPTGDEIDIQIDDIPNGGYVDPYFVKQDWGDSKEMQHALGDGDPYDSPDFDADTDVASDFGVYVNKKQKTIRLVDKDDGTSKELSNGGKLKVIYSHKDPIFEEMQVDASVDEWGSRERMMVIPDNKHASEIRELALAELRDNSQPLLNVDIEVYNDIYQVGDYIRIYIPEVGMDKRLCVFKVERKFDAVRRSNYPNEDFGQSVRLRLGNKCPKKLSDILFSMDKRIRALERAYNLTDLSMTTGFLVPLKNTRIYEEKISVSEKVSFLLEQAARVDFGRVGISRTI